MNIVKLRDRLMPNNYKMAELFNTRLKGKYAYWIQMRYIFPLDSLSYKEYIKYEQLDEIDFLSSDIIEHIDLYDEDCCMIDFVNAYVDICATEDANNIYNYIASNEYTTDSDVDIDMLRRFRAWLAEELLKLNSGIYLDHTGKYTDEQVHMLEYYKNNMYDDVVKYIDAFANKTAAIKNAIASNCGCCSSNAVSSLYTNDITVCDPSSIYTASIHNFMVKTFEDPQFWISLNADFIKLFKKYIDNIIQVGFVINKPQTVSNSFVECNCSTANDYNSTSDILNKLSISLGYIIDNDTNGHLNYMHDAFYNWAEHLYEYMYWPIN